MRTVYNLATYLASIFIWGSQFFSKKMKLFVKGRQQTFATLQTSMTAKEPTIWFHCASLGEFEQGVPVMESLKKEFPEYKLVVSFFSPSGYEVKKNNSIADVVVYLPMDTKANAARFIEVIDPKLACFVKYEVWPNFLFELKNRHIPTLLLSGLFRREQVFFKPYGHFMRKALSCFNMIFVQNASSKELLEKISIKNVKISGDTRFDRVSHQIEKDNTLQFMEQFKGSSLCMVCGSTWPEDEAVLLPFIHSAPTDVKIVIAPHKIDSLKIEQLEKKISKSVERYSNVIKTSDVAESQVLLIDTIGLLTKIYSYADIAYVGGGMGTTGLHNILEPATFGIPVVIGKNYKNFPEAKRLRSLAGLFAVDNPVECSEILHTLCSQRTLREKTGMIAGHYINSNTGASELIMVHIRSVLLT